MTMQLEAEPILTIDTNALQGLPTHGMFSTRGQYVVHDVLLRELVAKGRKDWVYKLWSWAKRHRKRVWIGLWWQDISETDKPDSDGKDWRTAVHPKMTEQWRHLLGRSDQPGPDAMSLLTDDTYEELRNTFVEKCDAFAQWMDIHHPDWRRRNSSEKEQLDFIRTPHIVLDYAIGGSARMGADRAQWEPALNCFPDRLAIGRWTRIILWYMMQRSIGATKDFANNWDDAHHAHLASYTGSILTKDAKLVRLIKAVFPYVRVYDD